MVLLRPHGHGTFHRGPALALGKFAARAFPLLFAAVRIFSLWRSQRQIVIGSLDDRAMLEAGVEFDKLSPEQQHDVLRKYRVGNFRVISSPDEAREAVAHRRAYELMRRFLLPLVAIYWLGRFWLPRGDLRTAWTDAPAVLAWVALLILALPQMIEMWTEPDEKAVTPR